MKTQLIILCMSAALVGCGSERRKPPMIGALSLTATERHGQQVYAKFCHQCHPNGEAGLGPAINSNPAPMAAFRLQVRSGLGAMPSFPDAIIPDRDLDSLLAFVDAQREQDD
jgi:mono/diheme cytochrome c family protein